MEFLVEGIMAITPQQGVMYLVGLVDQLGSVGDALDYLHQEIERRKQPKAQTQSNAGQ